MTRRTKWWITVNVAAAAILPVAFALWINRDVQHEYAMGWRTSTNGDSTSIPIAGFTILLWAFLVLLNVLVVVVGAIRRRSRRLTSA